MLFGSVFPNDTYTLSMVNGLHLYSAFIQSPVQLVPTHTRTHTRTHTHTHTLTTLGHTQDGGWAAATLPEPCSDP